jgi:hypothetical protein
MDVQVAHEPLQVVVPTVAGSHSFLTLFVTLPGYTGSRWATGGVDHAEAGVSRAEFSISARNTLSRQSKSSERSGK